MLIPIHNEPRDYSWGSPDLIPHLVGRVPSGKPEAEIWYGDVQPGRLDLTTDVVVRSPRAQVEYTAGRRLYGLVDGNLMYSFDRATSEESLQPFMWATLRKA